MKVPTSNCSISGSARCLAAALAALMIVSPVAAQSDGINPPTATPATHKTAHKAKKPAAKGKAPAPDASRASRTARTARIKEAFVASTELRPMAQQLANLRTQTAVSEGIAAKTLEVHGWHYDIFSGAVEAFQPAERRFIPLESLAAAPAPPPR